MRLWEWRGEDGLVLRSVEPIDAQEAARAVAGAMGVLIMLPDQHVPQCMDAASKQTLRQQQEAGRYGHR